MRINAIIFSGLLLISSILTPGRILAQDELGPGQEQWQVIESRFCTILYHPDVDIKKITRRIKINFFNLDAQPSLSGEDSAEEKLSEKVDSLFKKVEQILDMYPRKIHLTIKIFPRQKHLNQEYARKFGGANTPERISYYVHKYATIYTTEEVISQQLLAHEMAHAVCDHYFLILPPERIKELLAQYAEMHLED